MKSFKVLTFVMSSLAFGQSLWADMPSVNPRPKMLGMGGTGVAVLGSTESAMMNPASLVDLEKARWEILPLMMEVPFDLTVMSDYFDFTDALDEADTLPVDQRDAAKREAYEDFIGSIASLATATRVNFYPSWTKKNFHIGLLADFLVNLRFRIGGVSSNQVIELGGSHGTGGMIIGGSYSFLKNRLHVGVTLKPLYRVSITAQQEQTVYDLLKGSDPGLNLEDRIFGNPKFDRKGFAFGVDLGVRYDLPYWENYRPTVGLTYQDIGNTRFLGNNTPPNIEQSISVGVAIHPSWGITKNTFAFDLRNINEEQEFWNKLHLGFETKIWDLLAFRAGFGQAYLSGGVALLTRLFEMEVFVSSQEAGKRAHLQAQRTLGLKVQAGF